MTNAEVYLKTVSSLRSIMANEEAYYVWINEVKSLICKRMQGPVEEWNRDDVMRVAAETCTEHVSRQGIEKLDAEQSEHVLELSYFVAGLEIVFENNL